MENNLLARKINVFSIIGFIISLLPTIGVFWLVAFYQNKGIPTAEELFLEAFFLKPSLIYAGVGIVLAIIALIIIKKANEKGKILAYLAIALGAVTIFLTLTFRASQEYRLKSYELEKQQQIQEKLEFNK